MVHELKSALKRLLRPLLRFSRIEILTILAIGAQPFVLILLALVIAAIEYPWLVLAWFVQLVLLLAYAAVLARRRLRNRTENRHNPQVNGFLVDGLLEDSAESGALVLAPDARRRSLNRLVQRASNDELLAYTLHAGTSTLADAMALKATAGALDVAALRAVARLTPDARARSLGAVDADLLIGLARVAAIHDLGDGVLGALLDLAVSVSARASDAGRARLAELCVGERRFGDAAVVLDQVSTESWQRRLLLADLVNPFTGAVDDPDDEVLTAWLALVNPSFHAAGLEPVDVPPGAGAPFDRLTASVASGIAGGPMVTVIMSAYKPDELVLHAVRSIIDQTWRDWELLVMDDASGPEYDRIFAAIAALDDRVRVVRNDVNAGTYVRRNDALALARGEFVTMQDSDDWSHPRRLELQVQHLLSHPSVPANATSALRVTSELQFTQGRGLYLRLSEPSLMFRRVRVVDRIGLFDTVRKSGDSEYRLRIARAFATDVPHLMTRGPLMLMRFDAGSLSGSDLADGWTHPSRVSYRSAYQRWHQSAGASNGSLRLPLPALPAAAGAGNDASRAFAAPPLISGTSTDRGHLDTLIVVDARAGATLDSQRTAMRALLRRERDAGRSIGIMHAPAFKVGAQERPMSGLLHEAVDTGLALEVASVGEQVQVDVVLVWGDGCLVGVPDRVAVRPETLVLVAGDAGADSVVSADFAAQLARDRFGAEPLRLGVEQLRSIARSSRD